MNTQPCTLRDVITDCGGQASVARKLGCSYQYVHQWIQRGRLPLTDLKGDTQYSEKLAQMQQSGSLTAADIRRIGLRI